MIFGYTEEELINKEKLKELFYPRVISNGDLNSVVITFFDLNELSKLKSINISIEGKNHKNALEYVYRNLCLEELFFTKYLNMQNNDQNITSIIYDINELVERYDNTHRISIYEKFYALLIGKVAI